MAYSTFTLTGTYQHFNGDPASGTVEIIPSEKFVKDTAGNVILSGRVKVTLDESGAFSVTLPDPRDETLAPYAFGYTVSAKLHHTHLAAVSFGPDQIAATLDVEDVTPVDPSTFDPQTTFVEQGEFDLLEGRVDTLETQPVVTSYNDLTDKPTIPDSADDIGAEPAGTTAALDAELAPVAKSGTYTDLTGQPAIPDSPDDVGAAPAVHGHAAGDVTGLATVATSGDYADLAGQPTIPTTAADVGAAEASVQTTVESGRLSEGALNNAFAQRAGQGFLPSRDVTYAAAGVSPDPVDAIGDYLYGALTNRLYRTTDEAGPWALIQDFTGVAGDTGASICGVRELGDGEVLVLKQGDGVFKSSGWAADPTAATWAQKIDTGTANVAPFCVGNDAASGWVCVTAYHLAGADMTDSHLAWLSTDNGDTFNVVYDLSVRQPTWDLTKSHMHFITPDPYAGIGQPRLWVSAHQTDDEAKAEVAYSDDAGTTWTTLVAQHPEAGIATERGMLFGADNALPGLHACWHEDMQWRDFYRIRRDSIVNFGLATKLVRDPDTGTIYLAYRSTVNGQAASVVATDAYHANEVLQIPALDASHNIDFTNLAPFKGRLLGAYTNNPDTTRHLVEADTPIAGVPADSEGGVDGGNAGNRSVAVGLLADATAGAAAAVGVASKAAGNGVAVGAASDAGASSVAVGYGVTSPNYSAVIGMQATAQPDSVAIGAAATVSAQYGTAVGRSASVGTGVAVGRLSSATGSGVAVGASSAAGDHQVAVGQGAQATAIGAIAVGRGSVASSNYGVAVGHLAQATTGGSTTAVGNQAKATHVASTALGYNAATTASTQLAVGQVHIEMKELAADPAAPAADMARLYVKDDGAGNTVLCVRTTSGVKTVTMA